METDDAAYEAERKSRMKIRKHRYRRDELEKKGINVLRQIMNTLGINTSGCIDKRDLVDRLISSGKIEVVEGIPPVEITRKELNDKSVNDLRHLLRSYGLSTEGMLEKRELIDRLLESGRVYVVDPEPSSPQSYESKSEIPTTSQRQPQHNSIPPPRPSSSSSNVMELREDALSSMPIKELKNLMSSLGVSCNGCVERSDMINGLKQCPSVRIIQRQI